MSDDATITAAISDGVLDDQIAALVWLLGEHHVPLVVAGRPGSGRHDLASAFGRLIGARGNRDADVPSRVISAESLADIVGPAATAPGAAVPDEVRGLGTVLVLRDVPRIGRRLATAHYLRPVERDAAGHLQRRPPALLAAWDEASDRFDHFWWGSTPEFADRTGLTVGDFESAHAERAGLLGQLSAAGMVGQTELEAAVRSVQMTRQPLGHTGHSALESANGGDPRA